VELTGGNSDANITTFGRAAASANGFVHGVSSVTVAINHPPQTPTSPFYNNTQYVEAIVSRPVPTFLRRVLGSNSMTVGARAVAIAGSDALCVIALSNSTYPALSLTGAGDLTAPGCGIVSNNGIKSTNPSADINLSGSPVGYIKINEAAAGACASPPVNPSNNCLDVSGTVTPAPINMPAPKTDPLASYLSSSTPADPGGCVAQSVNGGTVTLNPGCYTSISVSSCVKLTFAAGTYYLKGDMTMSNCTVEGTDVTFYQAATNKKWTINSGTVTLSAPLTAGVGGIVGVLYWQNSVNTQTMTINGATIKLTGTLYLPNGEVDWNGGGASLASPCFLVSKIIKFTGGASLTTPPVLPGEFPLAGSKQGIVE
jgi:hypothetical protein